MAERSAPRLIVSITTGPDTLDYCPVLNWLPPAGCVWLFFPIDARLCLKVSNFAALFIILFILRSAYSKFIPIIAVCSLVHKLLVGFEE